MALLMVTAIRLGVLVTWDTVFTIRPLSFFPSLEGYDIETVSDVEERGQVIFVGGIAVLCQVIAAELFCEGFQLSAALIVQGGFDVDRGVREGQFFAAGEHLLHGLGGHGRPTSVFHERDGAVLEVPLGQMIDEVAHEGEDAGVVGCGGQYQLSVAEGVGYSLGHVAAGQIINDHIGAVFGAQLLSQQFHGLL